MNEITAFLETLVAASGDYNAAKVGNLAFLDAVYLDVKPEVARAGKTIQVYFPDLPAFTNQGGQDWDPTDIDPGYVDLVFNQRPGISILVRSFDQWQTSVAILEKFFDPAYKRGLEYFNGQIAAQVTTGNFNANPVIQSTLPVEVDVRSASNAWKALATAKVPLVDSNMLSILSHQDVHAQMLNDNQWTQESLVSAAIAKVAREQASLGTAFMFRKLWDQQAPATYTTLTGTCAITSGAATVTGTTTAFTTQAPAYSNIVFAGDPTATPYRVLSVASDTSLTLSQDYTGPTLTTSGATAANYTNVAMHKYSIALAVRPLQLVNDGTTQSRIVMLNGIPFRVMISFQHLKDGYLLSVDCGCAVGVIRPDFGVIIKS